MSAPIMLSAVKPSNQLTLGNYTGALKNWVRLQKDYKCIFFAVDMHSITVKQDPIALRNNTYYAIAAYLAAGIDPSKSTIFVQSHVPAHAELSWVLNCFGYMGELSRMTQYKDKSAKEGANIPVGLFTYPVLMAADILLYDTKLVPVGADQKQHIELTRDLAQRMNGLYGDDLFTIPDPYIAEVGSRIMDLQDATMKMGKSDSTAMGAVYLSDPEKEIEKKFKRAVTDSGSEITDADDKPGVKNLLSIQSALTGRPIDQIVQSYVGKMYGHLKVDTANIVIEELRPVQKKIADYLADLTELQKVLDRGAEAAAAMAEKKLKLVYERIGFAPSKKMH